MWAKPCNAFVDIPILPARNHVSSEHLLRSRHVSVLQVHSWTVLQECRDFVILEINGRRRSYTQLAKISPDTYQNACWRHLLRGTSLDSGKGVI